MRRLVRLTVVLTISIATAAAGPAATRPAPRVVQDHFPASQPARPKTLVFLCDGSAQMKSKQKTLQLELKKAIEKLEADQSFNVIVFRDGESTAAFGAVGPQPVNPENSKVAKLFIDAVDARGKSGAIKGIEEVFRNQPPPDMCFLLFCGVDLGDAKKLGDRIRALNVGQKTTINTVLMVSSRQEMDATRPIMAAIQAIATDNGGFFKLADANALP